MIRTIAQIAAVLGFLVVARTVPADVITLELRDHGNGNVGSNYGLRVDNGSPQTFSFSTGVVMELITSGPNQNQAKIHGTVQHNQSGQLWGLDTVLSNPIFTNADGSDWRSDTSGNLFNQVIQDLIDNGASAFGIESGNLKDGTFAADRLGFLDAVVTLTFQGPGDPDFTLDEQDDGTVTLFDYPQGSTDIPFVLAKGHRLSATSQTIVGFGWLDPRPPSEQSGDDGRTQDFLFRVDDPGRVTQPVIPEPTSVALWGVAAVGMMVSRRVLRRDRRK